jgi:hypothetical protein
MVCRIDLRIESVSTTDNIPIIVGDPPIFEIPTGAAPKTVILQPAINEIGIPHIKTDLVDLCQSHGPDGMPISPPIISDVDTAIVSVDQMKRIGRIDP